MAPVFMSALCSSLERASMAGQTCISACGFVISPCSSRWINVACAALSTALSEQPKLRTTNGNRYSLMMVFRDSTRLEYFNACDAMCGICSNKSALTMASAKKKWKNHKSVPYQKPKFENRHRFNADLRL
jgi:hypothetical protein